MKSLKKGARKKRKTAVAAAMDDPSGGVPGGDEAGQVKKRKGVKRFAGFDVRPVLYRPLGTVRRRRDSSVSLFRIIGCFFEN